MNQTAKKLALGSAFALFASTTLTGVASAAPTASEDNIQFSATDNKDCTATFEVINTTNSDWAEINYWTGVLPEQAPKFGKNEGSWQALKADPAFADEDGNTYEPYSEMRGQGGDYTYVRGLEAVTTTKVIDLSDRSADENGNVEAAYRMTNPDNKDYDQSLKNVTVTGCGESALGSLGSVDVFGSLDSGASGSLGSLFGTNEE